MKMATTNEYIEFNKNQKINSDLDKLIMESKKISETKQIYYFKEEILWQGY